jgi:hypothetical protein
LSEVVSGYNNCGTAVASAARRWQVGKLTFCRDKAAYYLCKSPTIPFKKIPISHSFLGFSKNRNSGLPYPQIPSLPPLTLRSRLRKVCNWKVNLSRGLPPISQRTRNGWGTRRYGFVVSQVPKCEGPGAPTVYLDTVSEPSWFPTHFAKNAKWMGHPQWSESLWSPTHFAKNAKWMGHPQWSESLWSPTHFAKNAKWMGHTRRTTAGPSALFGAKSAPNFAQDDSF